MNASQLFQLGFYKGLHFGSGHIGLSEFSPLVAIAAVHVIAASVSIGSSTFGIIFKRHATALAI